MEILNPLLSKIAPVMGNDISRDGRNLVWSGRKDCKNCTDDKTNFDDILQTEIIRLKEKKNYGTE